MLDFAHIFSFFHFADASPLVLFLVLFLATFISEDAACLAAGAFAAQGRISFAAALAACLAGIFAGDVLLYWTGRIFGQKLLRLPLIARFAAPAQIKKASVWLERRGAAAVFLSRFLTGLRLPTYLAAGLLRTDFLKFTLYFLLAAAVWTPLAVGATAFSQTFFAPQNWLIGIVSTFVLLKTLLHFSSWRSRRLFLGKLKRITNWEFWPLGIFYFPVVLYVLFLAFKHRNPTIFTCANPAILASGFVGESKNEIYRGLQKSPAAAEHILKYVLLEKNFPFDKKRARAQDFIADNHLSFPLVLKPDKGERGKGVKIVETAGELEKALKEIAEDYLLQEFAPGAEASVFYYRFPNAAKGTIFSVTEKHFPFVTGDGAANLETLILNDRRAVSLAKRYLEQNRARLDLIPGAGEKVRIIDIGTHSRGAIFADGANLQTGALEEKIDRIARGYSGFYFGRFDLRAASRTDFAHGENFKIIELNGVTSESTNIYDAKFSLAAAYRVLFRQWRIAFAIGAENYKLGTKPIRFFELVRLIFGSEICTEK